MSTAGAIAAVVVSHQSQDTIADCLHHLLAAEGVTQVRVVDNGSRDATLAQIQRMAAIDARVRFIANPGNRGFSVACNQGADESDAPWLAFVNPDCFVQPDSLARLRAHAGAGDILVGADLVDERGVHDPATRRCDLDFLGMLRRGDAAQSSIAAEPGVRLQFVDAVSGASMLLSRTLFERVGRFDEGYRLHVEDLDLCRRVRQAGGRVAVANDVVTLHLRGVSSRSRPWFVEWHKHRGLARYFHKFEAPGRSLPIRMLVPIAIWARFGWIALRLLAR